MQPIITDFFEKRTVFDIAVTGAKVDKQRDPDGSLSWRCKPTAKKTYFSPEGKPVEAEFDLPLPLVAFGERKGTGAARRVC